MSAEYDPSLIKLFECIFNWCYILYFIRISVKCISWQIIHEIVELKVSKKVTGSQTYILTYRLTDKVIERGASLLKISIWGLCEWEGCGHEVPRPFPSSRPFRRTRYGLETFCDAHNNIMQSDRNSFCGDIVSVSLYKTTRNKDNILDQLCQRKYVRIFTMMFSILYKIFKKWVY